MRQSKVVRTFVIEYGVGARVFWPEAVTFPVATAAAKDLAIAGLRPVVRKLEIPHAEVCRLTVTITRVRAAS